MDTDLFRVVCQLRVNFGGTIDRFPARFHICSPRININGAAPPCRQPYIAWIEAAIQGGSDVVAGVMRRN